LSIKSIYDIELHYLIVQLSTEKLNLHLITQKD